MFVANFKDLARPCDTSTPVSQDGKTFRSFYLQRLALPGVRTQDIGRNVTTSFVPLLLGSSTVCQSANPGDDRRRICRSSTN